VRDLAVLGHDPLFGGGGSAQTEAFLEGARALGREPDLLYAPHPVFAGRFASLDRVEAIRQLRAMRQLAPALGDARSVWVVATIATAGGAALRAGPYDCWIGTTLDDEWRGRRAGLGVAHRLAFGLSIPSLRRLERRVLRGARRVFVTSLGSRDAVAEAASLDPSDLTILPIPVDVDRFTPEPDDVWLSRLDEPVIAFAGRAWDPRKNIGLLLDALPLLRERIPGARVRLIGEPPAGPVPDGVEVVGVVPDVAAYLRSASLFVLPSHQEGFGIVAAEALACGVPVVSAPSHGPEELIRRSGAGRLLESFRPDELAAAAGELLSDVATLTAMRRRGREYVEREHSQATFRLLLGRAFAELEG
jgi:glycosyltransferase involved in cell wall biosynthesis